METTHTPLWAVAPFALYLFLIAVLPLFLGHFWEKNRNKLALGLVIGAPVIFYLLRFAPEGGQQLLETGRDYVAFMALLGALFVISGGIYLRGTLAGSTGTNAGFLAAGALLASLVGTTGASALLIRPLLRANERRTHTRHIVVFFIFIVANSGGMLTPLGDPPLFLGFLRGVPFTWTLRLLGPWALINGLLLVLFIVLDGFFAARDRRHEAPHPSRAPLMAEAQPLRIEGRINLLWLLGVVAVVFLVGSYGHHLGGHGVRALVQVVGMALFAALSMKTTPKAIHEANRFSWGPIHEVAVVFIGVFITMVPALSYLGERGASLGVTQPWQFFWASGALSSVLDNAPTYLTFASLATGVADAGHGVLSVTDLGLLAAHPTGMRLLTAVSCGSVCMGAVTYIGNGPNFMVKAIAEQHHVRMPSFFGYVLWSFAILIPIFLLVAAIFFR